MEKFVLGFNCVIHSYVTNIKFKLYNFLMDIL